MLLLASATTLSFRFSKFTSFVISFASKVMSLASVEFKSTLIFLFFDLIVTVTVLLLIFSSGSSETIGASAGVLNSETLPSLSTATLLPFSERPSTFPVKVLRASEAGESVGKEYSETFPSLSITTLLPFSESPSTFPVKGLRASEAGESVGT